MKKTITFFLSLLILAQLPTEIFAASFVHKTETGSYIYECDHTSGARITLTLSSDRIYVKGGALSGYYKVPEGGKIHKSKKMITLFARYFCGEIKQPESFGWKEKKQ